MFKKLFKILTILSVFSISTAGNQVLDSASFNKLYDSAWYCMDMGDYNYSMHLLKQIECNINSKSNYQLERLPKIYNLLGIINRNIGNYNESSDYYNKALNITTDTAFIALLYMNLGSLYTMQGELTKVLDYYNNAMMYSSKADKYKVSGTILYNVGYAYLNAKKWKEALAFTKKSLKIKFDTKDRDIGFSYLNLAIAYQNLSLPDSANYYFKHAIYNLEKEYGKDHFYTADAYMNYADFLIEKGLYKQSYTYSVRAYRIYLNTYGNKSVYTSNSLLTMGKLSEATGNYSEALNYYQKALISKVRDFNNPDIYSLPKEITMSDLDLIDIINHKARAFEKLAVEKGEIRNLEAALQCIRQSASMIEKLRQGYLSEISKLQLTGNESDVYSAGIRIAVRLYELTSKQTYAETTFGFSERSKYGILYDLRRDISARLHAGIPDTLAERERLLALQIEERRVFIEQENKSEKRRQPEIDKVQTKLFNLMREQERLINLFETKYSDYYRLKYQNKVTSTVELQNYLSPDQALIEYTIHDSAIYIFTITKDTFVLFKEPADTAFFRSLDFYTRFMRSEYLMKYTPWRKSSYNLYKSLILPIESIITGKELIIVPDSRLSLISFEPLTTEPYKENTWHMYQEEPYLLYKYPIGYSLSATLLVNATNKRFPIWKNFIGFAPDYTNSPDRLDNIPEGFKSLRHISWLFLGKAVIGKKATEYSFKHCNNYNIINFYTHGIDDTINPSLSRMFFSPDTSHGEDGYLYAYELSNMKINTNLAVLVTCYSGSGALSKGEGVLSVGRSFANTGCPAMVISLWSATSGPAFEITKEFYRNLLRGKSKSEALRLAKIKYLKQASPMSANPMIWSGLVLTGNPDPIFHLYFFKVAVLPIVLLMILIVLIFFRKKLINLF